MFDSMTRSLGWPAASSISIGERHLANTAPAALYSVRRAASESSPCGKHADERQTIKRFLAFSLS